MDQIAYLWAPTGDFGIGFDQGTAMLTDVEPRNAANGIRNGDRVDLAAMPFRDRGYLLEDSPPPVGQNLILPIAHNGLTKAVAIEAVEDAHRLADDIISWGYVIVGMIFIMTGVVLVWNRPSHMLWGLAVFLIRTHFWIVGPFVSPSIAALLIFGCLFVHSIGVPGIIIFASRFPDGRSDRFEALEALRIRRLRLIHPRLRSRLHPVIYEPAHRRLARHDVPASDYYLTVFVILSMKLRRNYHSTSAGFKWIVAGYGIGIILGWVGLDFFVNPLPSSSAISMFVSVAQLALMPTLPAAVAYSVIRHHSFGLGYFTNRTLVFAFLSIGSVSTFLIGLWIANNQLPSTLGIGTAMFVALLAGIRFQALHGRVIRFVDRIFLPHRYEADVSLDRIRETLRGTNDAKRVTGEVAETLGLTSVAVFERTSDGGFVRHAASGWPSGTAWHLLPGEALTHSLDDGAAIITLTDELADDSAFPVARARPLVALTIRRSGRVERAVFVGPYRDGVKLDRDAIRSVHGIFDDALVI